jgi:1-deoxy-D-xylulose-5-phosphate reductoisomerase
MKVPIQYAITYPERRPLATKRLRLEDTTLTFQEPDLVKFPALRLAYEALRAGGTAPTVLNAANEVAVAAFLRDEIPFLEIPACVERTLGRHRVVTEPSLKDVFAADAWARESAQAALQTSHATAR